MTSRSLDRNRHLIGRCHEGTVSKDEMALRIARHVMHSEDRVAGKLFEQAVFHHFLSAAQSFFCWLEDQIQRTVKIHTFRDVLGSS